MNAMEQWCADVRVLVNRVESGERISAAVCACIPEGQPRLSLMAIGEPLYIDTALTYGRRARDRQADAWILADALNRSPEDVAAIKIDQSGE